MKELIDLSFSPVNIFATGLLLFVGLYWLVFMFGFLDINFLDFDMDTDVDVEMDLDMDVDTDVDVAKDVNMNKNVELDKNVQVGGKGGSFLSFLRFLNLGDVPFMVFFSLFALFFWAGSILGNYYLHDGQTAAVVGVVAGTFVVALLITKILTQPFRKFFRNLNKGDAIVDLIGKICTLELGVSDNRLGQATIIVNGNHLTISVKSDSGKRIASGARCVIMSKSQDNNYYTVEQLEL